VYATNNLIARHQAPFFGWILIALDDEPIRIRIGTQEIAERAIALWPRNVRFMGPPVRFVTVALNPLHRLFRAFTRIPEPGAIALEYERFAPLNALMLDALISPRFTQAQAVMLKQNVIEICSAALPAVPLLDARAQRLMQLLSDNPRSSLDELADSLNLSYHRTSHLFTEAVGITVRTYQLWQKLFRASDPLLKGASLTTAAHAAGFVDSAHFSRAFQTAYGRSPRDAMKARRFVVYQREVFSKSAVDETLRAVDVD
jgi:AraC-like DNA-binding protein